MSTDTHWNPCSRCLCFALEINVYQMFSRFAFNFNVHHYDKAASVIATLGAQAELPATSPFERVLVGLALGYEAGRCRLTPG